MNGDNLIPFDPEKAGQKPATEEKPAEPVIGIEKLIESARSMSLSGRDAKRAAGHIEELSRMLYEAQDRGIPTTPEDTYLNDTAAAVANLLDCLAGDVRNVAKYIFELSAQADAVKKQLREGGA